MRRDDAIRLRHMLDAAREAMSFAQGRKRTDLDNDRMLVLSLVKAIEIIGEAAYQVSVAIRDQLTGLPGPISSVCATGWYTPTLTSIWMCSGKPCRMTCPSWPRLWKTTFPRGSPEQGPSQEQFQPINIGTSFPLTYLPVGVSCPCSLERAAGPASAPLIYTPVPIFEISLQPAARACRPTPAPAAARWCANG